MSRARAIPSKKGSVPAPGVNGRDAALRPRAVQARNRAPVSRIPVRNRPRIHPALLFALGLLPAIASRAQEALISERSADTAINSQTNTAVAPQPDHLRAGPVLLNLGTYLGVMFDDNINTSQFHPQSDTSIHAGLDLGFLWPATQNSQLQFASEVGYVTYLAHTRDDSVEIAPDSALTWGLSFDDGSVTLYDQFDYSEEVVTVPSLAGLDSLPRFDNTVGVRAQWSPKKWEFELGLSHDDFRSTSREFDYLDRGSEYFFLRGAWRFGQNTQAGLEFSASRTDYRLGIQSDNQSISIGPYFNWIITQSLSVNVSGGPTIYHFDAAPGSPASTLNSYYFDAELTHQLTHFISHHLSARRDVDLGYNKGNDYTELFSVSYGVDWTATQFATLGLVATYENGDQPLDFGFLNEHFWRVGVGVNASYRITDHLGSSLSFTHWDRSSDINGNNYSDEQVSCQLNYNF